MGKRLTLLMLACSLSLAVLGMPTPTNSEELCTGWPMWGRTPDACHWVPPECSPKSSDYELEWTYELTDYLLLRKIILVGNRLITYGYSGKFYSLLANPQDKKAKLLWTYDLKSPIKTPCYDNGRLFVCLESGRIECIDFKSKNLAWSKTLSGFIDSHPVVYRNRLYVNTSDTPNILSTKKCFFTCIDARTSSTIWSVDHMGRLFSAPVFAGNNMFVGTDDGRLFCYDITKKDYPGNVCWARNLGDKVYTPSVRNGRVYALVQIKDDNFEYVCLDGSSGEAVWKHKTRKRGEYYDFVTVNDKYFVCDSLDGFTCLDALTGKVVWINKELGFSATMTDDYVFTVNNAEVMCSDLESGNKLWSNQVKSPTLPTTIDRDRIYLMGDNTVYCFKLKIPSYPELVDIGDLGDPGSDITRPARVIVEPGVAYLEPGQTQRFTARAVDKDGKQLDYDNHVWEVVGDQGEIDTSGVFKALKEGSCQLVCTCGDISGKAFINVVKYLKAKPSPVEFKNVSIGSMPSVSLSLICSPYKNLDVTLRSSDERVKLSENRQAIGAGQTSKIDVYLITDKLMVGEYVQASISASYDGGSLEIPVEISVSHDRYDCFSVQPNRLDFGFVDRGSTKKMKFVIHSSNLAKITLKPSNPWIELSEMEFDMGVTSREITVNIASSSLPKGESFTGSIEILDGKSMCKYLAVPVFIETQSGIVLELTIDSDTALLNRKPVKMDAPARIINGRTMVPIRFVSESFGCKVEWDPKEGRVTIIRNDITIRLWKGKNFAKVNEDEKPLDSPPIIIKGRTYVPLRFISEPFGAKVNWDKVLKKITIIWDPL